MGLARSTSYYQPVGRHCTDEKSVTSRIEAICERWHAYGYRRVTSQLRREGLHREPQARGADHARARSQGRSAASICRYERRCGGCAVPESRSRLRAERSQSTLGCRSDVYPHCDRLRLPRRDPRRVVASCGRLRNRAADGCAAHVGGACGQRSQAGSRRQGASIIPIEVRSTMPRCIASCSRLTDSSGR